MSKLNKNKYNPEDISRDIKKILNIFEIFENSDLEKLNVKEFGKQVDKVTKELNKKYNSKDLDIEK